jgi:hypothetical protein
MKQMAWISVLALAACLVPAVAGDVEDSLESRWRGAWVLTAVEIASDCAGFHTTNHVNGELIQGRGRFRFEPGELAQVKDVNLKRSGLVLALSLPEPLLVSHQDGPFTLYDEARCLVDLDVELPRNLVKGGDLAGIEAALRPVLRRHATREEAARSRAWNGRRREPYPEDYDRTLAEHAAWKAETANAAIQARIERAAEETTRIADRISSDPDYLRGFAAGVEEARAIDLSECGALLGLDFNAVGRKPPQLPASLGSDAAARARRGYQDGARLVFGLESLRRLPGCRVPVPEVPENPPPPARRPR